MVFVIIEMLPVTFDFITQKGHEYYKYSHKGTNFGRNEEDR